MEFVVVNLIPTVLLGVLVRLCDRLGVHSKPVLQFCRSYVTCGVFGVRTEPVLECDRSYETGESRHKPAAEFVTKCEIAGPHGVGEIGAGGVHATLLAFLWHPGESVGGGDAPLPFGGGGLSLLLPGETHLLGLSTIGILSW